MTHHPATQKMFGESIRKFVRLESSGGIILLCGIGFTMSIFVGSLAFQEADIGYARIDRLAIILASLLTSIAGYIVLRLSCPKFIN